MREVLGASSVGVVGGLSLSLPGKELISATQIVFDEVTGLAAIMKMFDREQDDQPKSRVLLAPMMALSQPDQGLGFPRGTQLLPRIFLRNSGSVPTRVLATLDWRNQTSGTFPLPALTLSPGEVRIISLAEYEEPGQIPPDANWGTLKLAYTGRSADLVAVAVSYDKDSRYGLQTPFSEGLSHLWAGGMWHVDATHNTLITTGNGGSEETTAEVTLFYNGGKSRYRIEKMLAPGQQLWLDVGHLMAGQVPDADGQTLPPETMTGSYELRDLDHALVGSLYEGKLVIDKTYGHASYGCSTCCGYSTTILGPTPFGSPPGINNTDFIHATQTCGGYVDDVTDGGYNWGSSNTGVATLPNSTLHTVAVGSATGNTRVDLESSHPEPSGNCLTTTRTPQQTVTVASLSCSPSSVTRGGTTTCTATGPTGSTFSNWKFADGNGNTVNGSGTSSTWSGVVVTGGTVSVTVTSSSGPATPTAAITVNNRTNFAFTAVNPTQAAGNSITCYGGAMTTLPSPPSSGTSEGASCADLAFSYQTSAAISDNGPNNGYQYVTSVSSTSGSQPTQFQYLVVSDLLGATTFYNAQCGNYSSTNSAGFIAGSQLKQNVLDHEQGSVLSHWTEYRDAQNNSSNNVGRVLEAMTAGPST